MLCKVECCAGDGISGLDIAPVDPTAAFLGALVDFDKEPAGKHDSAAVATALRIPLTLGDLRFQEPNRLAAAAAGLGDGRPSKMGLRRTLPGAQIECCPPAPDTAMQVSGDDGQGA